MKLIFKRLLALAMLFLCVLELCACGAGKPKKYTDVYLDYFDTATTVIGYAKSEEEFSSVSALVEQRLLEYHRLYDIYNTYDGITNLADINSVTDGVHKPHSVGREIIDLLLFSKEIYSLTGGEVNVTMGSVLSLWHAARQAARSKPDAATLPDADMLADAAAHTDIDDLIIDEENMTVFLADPKMTLDVGAVAKGFAVEMIANELSDMGVSGYLLNVGGNVRGIGKKPDGTDWTAGITDPAFPESDSYKEHVYVLDKALVTSGSYQRFFNVGDKRYHHIIDKDTLYPSEYFESVTVICKDSGLADSLSTALFNMSYEDGYALIESIEGAEAMWIDSKGKKLYSSGFKSYCAN